jgi:glycosyltransferase involved in cell wall biosynthesis
VPAEVAVVDGSRNRRTEQAVQHWRAGARPPYDLLYVEGPTGLTLQRNIGIDATGREFVFFLDDDCVPEPRYFRAIRDIFLAASYREVGGIGGAIVNEIGGTMSRRWKLRLALRLYPRGEPGQYYPTATSVPVSLARPFSGAISVDILPGCTIAFRREVFDREQFSSFFDGYSQGEDLEMSLHVGKSWKLLWCGDAHVNHFHATADRPAAFQKGRMEVHNRFFIWKRHSQDATLSIRIRFWLDILYVFAYDLVSSVARPGQPSYLQHALGVGLGAAEYIFSPPRYREPPAMREYQLSLENLLSA